MKVLKKYTDVELLSAISSNDHLDDAIRSMYRDYYNVLSRYVLNNKGNEEDAQDVFQEVLIAFVGLVQNGKYRGEASIKTILYSLAKNIWLNEMKKRSSADKRELNFENNKMTLQMDISHEMMQSEMQKQTMTIIDKLGDTCKKILLAFYYENKPIKEILSSLEYENEQVVRNKKSKCLKQLEQYLSENPDIAKALKYSLNI